jgi:carbon monoxide dehydrogenase subunit G
MELQVDKEFTVNATPDRVWEVIFDEFEHVAGWASGVAASGPNPHTEPLDEDASGGRICQVPGLGATDERIIAHDADARTLSYTVGAEKIPSFVQNMTNNWTLTPAGDGTRVAVRLTADIGGPLAPIMKPMMRRQLNKQMSFMQVDPTTYAETGEISARKANELVPI